MGVRVGVQRLPAGPRPHDWTRPSTSSQSVWVDAQPLLGPTQTFPGLCVPVAKWMEMQLPSVPLTHTHLGAG